MFFLQQQRQFLLDGRPIIYSLHIEKMKREEGFAVIIADLLSGML
jgi:hypothetical protein